LHRHDLEIAATFATRSLIDQVSVDIALAWVDRGSFVTHSFVNQNRSVSGTHVDGLWEGFASYAKTLKKKSSPASVKQNLSRDMVAIIHVGLYHPSFAGPTKEHLVSPEAGMAVARTLAADLPSMIGRNSKLRGLLEDRL
jgi:DNA gyrase/topoisomerase IV subunit B